MAHNVLAVYDVLATRISKRKGINPFLPCLCVAGLPKCGCSEPWERGQGPTDLGERNPEPPNRRRSVNRPVMCRFRLLIFKFIFISYNHHKFLFPDRKYIYLSHYIHYMTHHYLILYHYIHYTSQNQGILDRFDYQVLDLN